MEAFLLEVRCHARFRFETPDRPKMSAGMCMVGFVVRAVFLILPARSKAHPGHAVLSSPQMQAFDSVHHLESLA